MALERASWLLLPVGDVPDLHNVARRRRSALPVVVELHICQRAQLLRVQRAYHLPCHGPAPTSRALPRPLPLSPARTRTST